MIQPVPYHFDLLLCTDPHPTQTTIMLNCFQPLSHLADDSVRLCVVGDFNLPDFNWDLFIYPENFLHCTAADFIRNNGSTQLVIDPTRDDSILDLILCIDVLCCDNVCSLAPLDSSDHVVSFRFMFLWLSLLSPILVLTDPTFLKLIGAVCAVTCLILTGVLN